MLDSLLSKQPRNRPTGFLGLVLVWGFWSISEGSLLTPLQEQHNPYASLILLTMCTHHTDQGVRSSLSALTVFSFSLQRLPSPHHLRWKKAEQAQRCATLPSRSTNRIGTDISFVHFLGRWSFLLLCHSDYFHVSLFQTLSASLLKHHLLELR